MLNSVILSEGDNGSLKKLLNSGLLVHEKSSALLKNEAPIQRTADSIRLRRLVFTHKWENGKELCLIRSL